MVSLVYGIQDVRVNNKVNEIVKNYLDEVGFKIINIIIWKKSDPPPLIYKNKFR